MYVIFLEIQLFKRYIKDIEDVIYCKKDKLNKIGII